MRLIDADALAAKIIMEAPDFMDDGSSITKAFILAMVKTRSVTPTVDAVPVARCRDCKYGTEMSGNIICHKPKHDEYETDIRPFDWFCADGERRENDKTDQ